MKFAEHVLAVASTPVHVANALEVLGVLVVRRLQVDPIRALRDLRIETGNITFNTLLST